jgi:hypothetical protein
MSDYLAYILIGGGSAWGRSESREAAISFAIKSLKDWNTYYDVSDKEVTVCVIDVSGYDEVVWEYNDVSGKKPGAKKFEKIDRPIEREKRQTPKWPMPKRRA